MRKCQFFFSKAFTPFYSLTSMSEDSNFSITLLTHINYLLDFSRSSGHEVGFPMVLICISLMILSIFSRVYHAYHSIVLICIISLDILVLLPRNHYLTQGYRRFTSLFSSTNYTILALMVKSTIPFEVISCVMRLGSNLILLHMGIPLSQHHFLKGC